MSKPMDFTIDSCVFFRMIPYNNFVDIYGDKNLGNFIMCQEIELKEMENELRYCLGDDFFKKFEGLEFDEQIERYKNYARNIESRCYNGMNKFSKLAEESKTDEEREKNLDKFNQYYYELFNLTKASSIDFNLTKINEYKVQRETIEIGKIFEGALRGDYRLFSTFISLREILSHTSRRDNPHWLFFDKSEINSLQKRMVKVLTTDSEEILKKIDTLAEDYRTKNDNPEEQEMPSDTNLLDEYANSKTIALSNMAGMNFITLKKKGFIYDPKFGKNNDRIRNHIKSTNLKYNYTTDASVYSPREVLEGKAKEPKIKSKIIDSVSVSDASNSNVEGYQASM